MYGGHYPAGAEYERNAPWNRKEETPDECPDCNNKRYIMTWEDENDPFCVPEREDCERCLRNDLI